MLLYYKYVYKILIIPLLFNIIKIYHKSTAEK
jgi:hypothetical protein